jgi:vanillate O-demethylase monooxygenase subunit
MGDPTRADESLIPNWWWMDHPDWTVSRGDLFHIQANYELISDNLLDLAHVPFLHKGTIGSRYITDFPIKTERTERTVRMTRLMQDVVQAPFHRRLKPIESNVDRWTRVDVTAPAHVLVNSGNAPTGTGALTDDMAKTVNLQSPNEITPETASSSFLFYAHARNFAKGDPAVTAMVRDEMLTIYREDIAMMEGQQARIARQPNRQLMSINQDAPVVAMRRVVTNLIAEERAAESKELRDFQAAKEPRDERAGRVGQTV